MEMIEGWTSVAPDRQRLVFNGFTLSSSNALSDYDLRAGDTMYLYTLRTPEEPGKSGVSETMANVPPGDGSMCTRCNCCGSMQNPAPCPCPTRACNCTRSAPMHVCSNNPPVGHHHCAMRGPGPSCY
eukprot:GHVT01038122.1.p1 GENE.GHVT01038122.1~~GHVT01038122.1.p1  ORF type:complete len:127 (-),score=3.89 GHVT01038122.1:682-1062(-)